MNAETIIVDGIEYHVFVVYPSRLRNFAVVEGSNAGKSLSFRKIRAVGGTEYAYNMMVTPNPAHPDDYDAFYEVISAPVDYHRVIMPYGQNTLEFDAAVYSGEDVDMGITGDKRRWGNLQVRFEPMEPQRRA